MEKVTYYLSCVECGQLFDSSCRRCPHDGAELIESDPSLAPGTMIDERYCITRLLGSGAFGTVYEAEHLALDKHVAIKLLNRCDGHGRERFRREAEVISRITHENVVACHDFGFLADGRPYFVMDLIQGEELSDYLQRVGPLPVADAVMIGSSVCRGLAAAHRNNIVHRDLKPGNILIATNLDGSKTVKVVDFGLAKPVDEITSGSPHLTRTGDTIGTPQYMSPEQCRGQPLDGRADIYSLGCILYEALVGRRFVDADSAYDCMALHVGGAVPDVSEEVDVPDALSAIIRKALSKDPAHRYQTADKMLVALNAVPLRGGRKLLRKLKKREARLVVAAMQALIGFSVFALCLLIINLAPWRPAPIEDYSKVGFRNASFGKVEFEAPKVRSFYYAGGKSEIDQRYVLAGDRLFIEIKEYPESTFAQETKQQAARHSTYKNYKSVSTTEHTVGPDKLEASDTIFCYGPNQEIFERHVIIAVGSTAYKLKLSENPKNGQAEQIFERMLDSFRRSAN